MKDAATLSMRETQIAKLIAWGMAKKEIASKLFLSERTIENHTRNIYKKAGVTKSNELAAWWFCKTYNIPHSDSPIIKKMVYISVLVLIAMSMIFTKSAIMLVTLIIMHA